jgi:hypothetical protein
VYVVIEFCRREVGEGWEMIVFGGIGEWWGRCKKGIRKYGRRGVVMVICWLKIWGSFSVVVVCVMWLEELFRDGVWFWVDGGV